MILYYFLLAASTTHYLIAGGYAHGYAHGVSTEVIDLSNSQPMDPDTFGDLPTKFVHHVGGLLGSNPILCGGKDKDDSCFSWKKTVDSSSIRGHGNFSVRGSGPKIFWGGFKCSVLSMRKIFFGFVSKFLKIKSGIYKFRLQGDMGRDAR